MNYELWQWVLGAVAGVLVGLSKTGVPGVGILTIPLLAAIFEAGPSVGIMLPMLIFGDCFAVAWYRRHAQWKVLIGLLPWVLVGLGVGSFAMWAIGKSTSGQNILSILIGSLVLVMLALHLLQRRMGDSLDPRSSFGVAIAGIAGGFATTVSNAAGPIMTIYLMAHRLDKHQFMGTFAWFFFIINITKLPIFISLSVINPQHPIMTVQSLLFVAIISPFIFAGVLLGKWVLPRISQRTFDSAVLVLSAAAAIYLVVSHI